MDRPGAGQNGWVVPDPSERSSSWLRVGLLTGLIWVAAAVGTYLSDPHTRSIPWLALASGPAALLILGSLHRLRKISDWVFAGIVAAVPVVIGLIAFGFYAEACCGTT